MDIKGIEAIMRLHQELASRLPKSMSGIAEREEPQLPEDETKAMRALLEQRLRMVVEAREVALSRFDEEIGVLKEALADVDRPGDGERVRPARSRPAKPPK